MNINLCQFIFSIAFLNLLSTSCTKAPTNFSEIEDYISISPEYRNITIPPNISAMNFLVNDSAVKYFFKIWADNGNAICRKNKTGKLELSNKQWKKLVAKSNKIYTDIFLNKNNIWYKSKTIENCIVLDSIDTYLTYRYFLPSFQVVKGIGIYRRNLVNFKSRPLVKTEYENLCFNCHVYAANDSRTAMFHVRESKIGGTIILNDDSIYKIKPKVASMLNNATYPAWHPSGKYIAFSANKVDQLFYASKLRRDAYDVSSNLVIYDVDNNKMISDSTISGHDYLETYPCWDASGQYLYFCRTNYNFHDSAKTIFDAVKYRNVLYDLMRLKFEPEKKHLGEPEYVLHASEIGKSIVTPRISPDGKYLLFCALDYGNFPLFHKESDFWVLNLQNGNYRKLANINSPYAEGYHCWSKNSRWIVYSSRALDGVHSSIWIAYFDENGKAHKPFILPQKDPAYYQSFVKSFTFPELTINDANINMRKLYRVVNSSEQILPEAVGYLSGSTNVDGISGATLIQ